MQVFGKFACAKAIKMKIKYLTIVQVAVSLHIHD